MLALAGCTADRHSVVLGPDEVDLARCEAGDPVPVENLVDPPECDLAGQQLLFPDGHLMTVPEIAGNAGDVAADEAWSVVNLGVYGPVAGYRLVEHETEWWGTERGIELWMDTGEQPGQGEPGFG